jgi:FkbM family methyltransferase
MKHPMKLALLCSTWTVSGIRFRRGHVSDLQSDPLFKISWSSAPGGVAHVAAENCDSFAGNGFACFIESPEHALVHKWIPSNATVLEFGARFGTTTCEIAKKLGNSGRLVTVEPDNFVWRDLEQNIKSHNCHAHVLRGAISASPIRMLSSGYGGRSDASNLRGGGVPTFKFDEVEQASGLKFDTLLIDCEGCAQDMMDQIGPKIQSQINLIVIEADMPDTGGDCTSHCMNYKKFFDFLKQSGFAQVDEFNDCDRSRSGAPEGTWCGGWINHYAFRRQK